MNRVRNFNFSYMYFAELREPLNMIFGSNKWKTYPENTMVVSKLSYDTPEGAKLQLSTTFM